MKATCPACGFSAGMEAYIADAEWRRSVVAIAALPSDIGLLALRYAGMFRPGKRNLTAHRASMIFTAIHALITTQPTTYNHRSSTVPQRIWRESLLIVIEKPSVTRPLKNHNLLKTIAFSLLDKYDAEGAERGREADAAQAARANSARNRPTTPLYHTGQTAESSVADSDPFADMDTATRKQWFDRAAAALERDGIQPRFITAPLIHAKAIEAYHDQPQNP